MPKTTKLSKTVAEVVVSEVEEGRVVDLKPVMGNGSKVDSAKVDDLMRTEAENVFDELSLPYHPQRYEATLPEGQLESLFPMREKSLASSRFVHQKPNKITPEGKFTGKSFSGSSIFKWNKLTQQKLITFCYDGDAVVSGGYGGG